MALPTFTFSAASSRMDAVGSSLAYDLAKRISQSKGLGAADAAKGTGPASTPAVDDEQAAIQAEKQSQLQKLESALANTVSYMKEKHGEQSASAMVGIVYKSIGDGELNEQSLGNAFLDVTRFIDKNFGTDSGDEFMSHLNGSLNDSMNAFFDNGLNETFMVAPTSPEGGGSAGVEGILSEITEQYAQTIKEMLEEVRANPEHHGAVAAYAGSGNSNALVGVMKDMVI